MDLDVILRTESERFRAALRDAAPDATVPSCPGWTAADLAWHLARVQWGFASIVAGRHTEHPGPAIALAGLPRTRPSFPELLELDRRATDRLLAAFADVPPATPLWSFVDRATDVAWALRRQAHEALVHRIDAELTAGGPPGAVEADVAADGVHELLTELLHRGNRGEFAPSGIHVDLRTTDTGDRWSVALGRLRRTDDVTGDVLVRAGAELRAPVGRPHGVVAGPAVRLHAWAWGRDDGRRLRTTGDPAIRSRTREALSSGT